MRGLPVTHVAFALPQRALVPRHPEPLEIGHDRIGSTLDIARRIGVVDPEEKGATMLVGKPAVRDRAQSAA